MKRRQILAGTGALAFLALRPARAADDALPSIPALTAFLAGRTPRFERIKLDLPDLADNGFAVPMRVAVLGPFTPGPYVKSLRVFAESNPVPDLAVFEFPQPMERIEIDTRIRLATTQRVAVVAEMTDNRVYARAMEVVVTLAGCMDGT
jgi:sulfur-oxidizing protein SoxY